MPKPTVTCVSTLAILVTAFWLADGSIGAERLTNPAQTHSGAAGTGSDEELEEVLVEGRRPETDTRKLQYWMDRLVGEFRYEGYVEQLGDSGIATDRADAQGSSHCVRIGTAAAVQCQINVAWPEIRGRDGAPVPGGLSPFSPAVAVYSLEVRARYVGYFNVDADGVATNGKGWLLDDTLIARSPCADFPDKCERVVRVEAPADARVIRMRIDLERDGKPQLRYNFQWIRLEQGSPAAIAAADVSGFVAVPPVGDHANANAPVPPEVSSWLRRIVGKYRLTQMRACRPLRGRSLDEACPEVRAELARATRNGPVEAQCQGIGAGPGVRCVINMEWPESGIPPKPARPQIAPSFTIDGIAPAGRAITAPSYSIYGFDPVQRGITVLHVVPTSTVGASSLAEGQLRDGELTSCNNLACSIREHVGIAPGGEWIRFATIGQLTIGGRTESRPRQEAVSWRMYRMKEGVSTEAEDPHPAPRNLSPRR